eukprot:1160636-Pelagomonas_calceolata.AAC.9
MATGRGRAMPSRQDTAAHEDVSFTARTMHHHGQSETRAASFVIIGHKQERCIKQARTLP